MTNDDEFIEADWSRFFCLDCGIDTSEQTGICETYMVHTAVWTSAFYIPRHPGMLCIGCLEARLGRQLTPDDFTSAPLNDPSRYQKSGRLRVRMARRADRGRKLQEEINEEK